MNLLDDVNDRKFEKGFFDDNDETFNEYLNNTNSPTLAEGTDFYEVSNLPLDPFEFIDGGLKFKKNAENDKSESESPELKKMRLMSSPGIKEKTSSPDPVDDRTKTLILSKPSSIQDSSFLNDFCWHRAKESKRFDVVCCDVDIYEIFHTMRLRSKPIKIPQIFKLKDNINSSSQKASNNLFQNDVLNKNCSVSNRKETILAFLSKREQLRLSSATIHLGLALLDKCLNSMIVHPDNLLDLTSVTMVLASKVEEVNFLSLRDIITNNLSNETSIKLLGKLERLVLSVLSFNVTFPTPLTFANYLLIFLGASPAKINMTHYLLELAAICVSTRNFSSHLLAHAATCLAFSIDSETKNSIMKLCETEVKLKQFAQISPGHTRNIMKILAREFKSASLEKHGIFIEYKQAERDSVASTIFPKELEEVLGF